jgi:hypothetical protein
MGNLKLLNDKFQKLALDVHTPQGKNYASLIIHEATGIIVHSIYRLDRVVSSEIKSSKSSEFDNYFLVNDHYVINIEIQNRSLSIETISEKSQYYLSMMMTSFTKKGIDFGSLYEFMIIILYNGSISNSNDFIVPHTFTSCKPTNYIGMMKCSVLQFGKLLEIYKQKGIENMSKLERTCFYMKYKYDNKYQKEIEQMVVKEDTVEYLDHLYERFDLDALRNLAIKTQEYNEQLLRYEERKAGIVEGKNEGRIEMCIDLINDGTLTIEQAAKKLNISVEKMKKYMEN